MVTVRKGGENDTFNVISHLDTKAIGKSTYAQLMRQHISHQDDVAVTHGPADTPCKRLETLHSAVPAATTPEAFNKRLRLG